MTTILEMYNVQTTTILRKNVIMMMKMKQVQSILIIYVSFRRMSTYLIMLSKCVVYNSLLVDVGIPLKGRHNVTIVTFPFIMCLLHTLT